MKRAYTINGDESFGRARLRKKRPARGLFDRNLLAAALRYCASSRRKRVETASLRTGNKYLSKLYNDFWMEDQGFIQRPMEGDLRDLVGRPHAHRATITVGPDDAITTAHNRLRNAGFSQLPVMENDRVVGVLTEEDIMRFTFGQPELLNAPVRGRSQHFASVDRKFSINNLVSLLAGVPYVAVTDGDRFLGLITRTDVLNYLRKQLKDTEDAAARGSVP